MIPDFPRLPIRLLLSRSQKICHYTDWSREHEDLVAVRDMHSELWAHFTAPETSENLLSLTFLTPDSPDEDEEKEDSQGPVQRKSETSYRGSSPTIKPKPSPGSENSKCRSH